MVVMLWPGASSADGTMFGNLFGYKDFHRQTTIHAPLFVSLAATVQSYRNTCIAGRL